MKIVHLTDLIDVRLPVTEVYTGREKGCRCGCHGRYFKPGDKGFARALNKAKALNPEIVLCDTDAEVNAECVKTRNAVAADGTPRGYAIARNSTIAWVDIVLDGCYPHQHTITLYFT